jgi:hypothetical protein
MVSDKFTRKGDAFDTLAALVVKRGRSSIWFAIRLLLRRTNPRSRSLRAYEDCPPGGHAGR